jgi:predicted phosphodiesterase
MKQADILVTHEAPGAHRHGFEVLDALALMMRAKLLMHGHHHEPVDYPRMD